MRLAACPAKPVCGKDTRTEATASGLPNDVGGHAQRGERHRRRRACRRPLRSADCSDDVPRGAFAAGAGKS